MAKRVCIKDISKIEPKKIAQMSGIVLPKKSKIIFSYAENFSTKVFILFTNATGELYEAQGHRGECVSVINKTDAQNIWAQLTDSFEFDFLPEDAILSMLDILDKYMNSQFQK